MWYVPKGGGAETQLSGNAIDFVTVKPVYENIWYQRFSLKVFITSAIEAEPANALTGLIKLKFSNW